VQRLASSTDPAAARIANAQTALNDIWNLEDDVARAQAHFETLRLIALKQADEIIEFMRSNRNITAKNEETGTTAELEINFWTKGEFNKLESEVKTLKQELEDKKDAIELNEDRVKAIENRLIEIKNAQNAMRDETVRQGLASEHRVEISEDIVGALLEQGFELQGDNAHNYMGGEEATDAREGVFAVLKDANGREITIIVNTSQSGCNQVIFQRNDDKPRTEDEFRRDLNDLKQKVQESSGVNLGASTPIPAVGDTKQQELIDPAKLAREGLKQDVKRRLGLV
jgi:DNA gyrase/topoisomerase IV subunit A